MSFCKNCGAQVPDGAAVCPACGKTTDGRTCGGTDKNGGWQPDTEENRDICILCYLGPLFLIPYFSQKGSPFVSFHCNQGLVLFLFEVIGALASHAPFIGWIIRIFCGIFIFACLIIGIVNVSNGKMKKLPLIGGIEILK